VEINVTQIIIAVIGLLFTAVIIPLVKAAFEWLKGKTQNEALRAALEEAKAVADQVVTSLQQSLVEGFKAENGGKLTAEKAKEVLDMALDKFINDVSDKTLALIENNAVDVASYIANLIESRLFHLKNTSGG
jgi:molybdopterin-guanine dinucleotide biosynthesis protein